MRPGIRAHGFVATALLIVAVIAILGHVCVLPAHVHAVPAESHGAHGDEPADHGVHTASCDALKSTSPPALSVPAAAWTPLAVVEAIARRSLDSRSTGSLAESPPLFLLHAALLI